jgi:hypothetical protein
VCQPGGSGGGLCASGAGELTAGGHGVDKRLLGKVLAWLEQVLVCNLTDV